ncbi:LysM peptidoglycan-binding domain-containing protein [Deltaproteobacteria bacterium]|nr:LysM peptidoglycan-binding domain-containing protein [Deltaproteobacteria bacterium]
MGKIIKKRYIMAVLLLVIGCFFIIPSGIYAQNLTHMVQKGDTLWDICESYYGDPNLWPKLWEMNPFVTNPHLLKPGDIINLFEQEPEKVMVEEEEEEVPVMEAEPEPEYTGINIAGLTNLNSLGFLSFEKIIPWGSLFASDNDGIVLSKDDTVYVIFDENRVIEIGDEFSIGKSSDLLEHPVTGKDLGYTYSVNGRLVIEERLGLAHKHKDFYNKENVFKAKVLEAHEPVHIDDTLLPYQPGSPCITPTPLNKELVGNIVASKAQRQLLEPNSIVYLDLGLNDGISRGNIFEVIEANIVPDPKPEGLSFWKSNIILPDKPLGQIIILEAKSDTSTALVLSASDTFSPGIFIKNLSWVETPDFLSIMFDCPVE